MEFELPFHILLDIVEKCSLKGLSNLANAGDMGYEMWKDVSAWKSKLNKLGISHERHTKYPYSWKRSIDNKLRQDENIKNPTSILLTNIPVRPEEKIIECVSFEDGSLECLMTIAGRYQKVTYETIQYRLRSSTEECPCYEGVKFKIPRPLRNKNLEFGSRHGCRLVRGSAKDFEPSLYNDIESDGRWVVQKHFPFKVSDWITGHSFQLPIPETHKIEKMYTKKSQNMDQEHFALVLVQDDKTIFTVYSKSKKGFVYHTSTTDHVLFTEPCFVDGKCISVGILSNQVSQNQFQNPTDDQTQQNARKWNIHFMEIESGLVVTKPIPSIDTFLKLQLVDNFLITIYADGIDCYRTNQNLDKSLGKTMSNSQYMCDWNGWMTRWNPRSGDLVLCYPVEKFRAYDEAKAATTLQKVSFPVYFGTLGKTSELIERLHETVCGYKCILFRTENNQYTMAEM